MKTRNRILRVGVLLFAILAISGKSYGQLISPGELSEAHKDLEGITNCTSCHVLGSKGISNERCLNCHTPLKARIDSLLGYHATVIDQNCASCHNEHIGRSFEIVNWDTATFDHKETGYTLIGKHLEVSCKTCHTENFITDQAVIQFKGKNNSLDHTFLGLGTDCANCHQSDSPHGDQFIGQDCQSCHTPVDWKDLSAFNHDNTNFKLLGKHMEVECSSCHTPVATQNNTEMVLYTGLKFDECIDCHTDVHKGTLGTQCSTCHSENSWNQFVSFSEKTFNHETTGFPLVGKHKTIACGSCHNPNASQDGINMTFVESTLGFTYPHPEAGKCISCHEDYHKNAFVDVQGGTECANCHTADDWLPTTYDIKRHNTETRFALTGAHLAVACVQCHQPDNQSNMVFHFSSTECESCHTDDNPHGLEFQNTSGGTLCADCHTTTNWTTDIKFDHSTTRFPLTGAHSLISCSSCHQTDKAVQISFEHKAGNLPLDCEGCHAKDDPHHGQFAQSVIGSQCDACHTTEAFTMQEFDHSRTRFPLDGAHINVACASCHQTETGDDGKSFVRFRPLEITCESCHANTNK